MKKLNKKGYLTVEIILAAVISFTIAFFLMEVTIDFSDSSDNYYTDTIFITDKALVSNNIKKNIQNDINDNGVINSVTCNNNKCTIKYQNNITKDIEYSSSSNEVSYNNDTYSKKIKEVDFKTISVCDDNSCSNVETKNYIEGDYIRFVISFDNIFEKNNYDINILIYNGNTEKQELLVDYITDLYENADYTKVYNNEIEYKYAVSVNLMKDRYGGQTTSLDDGNIRYYGVNPNNYIDIGEVYPNEKILKNWEELYKLRTPFESTREGCLAFAEEHKDVLEERIKTKTRFSSIDEFCDITVLPAGRPILWRIIGVFDGKVRIRREESIGEYIYDTSRYAVNTGYGVNEWSQADLMKLLNPGYEENEDYSCSLGGTYPNYIETCEENLIKVNNSLWWNRGTGRCYNSYTDKNVECDFSENGLSEIAKSLIVDQELYLGGYPIDTVHENIYANEAYQIERGSEYFKGPETCVNRDGYKECNDKVPRTLRWTGKVGLIYPSDFAYANDFLKCGTEPVLPNTTYYINRNVDCDNYNWMTGGFSWTLSPLSTYAYDNIYMTDKRLVVQTKARIGNGAWPVVTLSPLVLKKSGTGTREDPYKVGF